MGQLTSISIVLPHGLVSQLTGGSEGSAHIPAAVQGATRCSLLALPA